MPKKARQAHIPRQVTRKRKAARRDAVRVPADAYIDVSGPVQVPAYGREPVGPIPLASGSTSSRRSTVAPRAGSVRAGGQLPTFERAYLVEELRRIGITAAGLLAVIVALTVLLR